MNADINDDAPGEASSGARVELRASRVRSFDGLNFYISEHKEQGHLANDERIFTKNIVCTEVLHKNTPSLSMFDSGNITKINSQLKGQGKKPDGVSEEIAGANYLRVVVLCSASLKGNEAKRCVELFGKEYECLASEDRCPVYIAELINIADGSILQSVEASIHIYASMGNMNVQSIVGRPTNESRTQIQNNGDIINGAMKLQKCQKPGGNCLSDGDTLMDCFDSLHIKRAYRCSDIYGKLAECVPKLQECVELADSRYMYQGRSDTFKSTKGGPHTSGQKDRRKRPGRH